PRHIHSFPTRRSSDLAGWRLPISSRLRLMSTVRRGVGCAREGIGSQRLTGRWVTRLSTGDSSTSFTIPDLTQPTPRRTVDIRRRSEEHTSELQSRENL